MAADSRWLNDDFGESLRLVWAKIRSGEPIALARLADGEIAIMDSRKAYSRTKGIDGWSWNGGSSKLGDALADVASQPELTHGIPCRCCDSSGADKMAAECRGVQTFANIFVNGNWPEFCRLCDELDRPVFLIARKDAKLRSGFPCSVSGLYGAPSNCVFAFEQHAERYYAEMALIARQWANVPIFVAAGPLGTVLVHYLWQHNPKIQAIDIGSALDPWLFGRNTRPYQDPSKAVSRKVCRR
jgi:hypothetical protein